jgi:dephospho-CoA kinase
MRKPWPDKTIIGLTGNIATGKSVVMRLAAQKGALTLDADQVVHEIMDQDARLQAAIADAFGEQVRTADGRIDRPALGTLVFNDPEAMRTLEGMIHPVVRQVIFQRIGASAAGVVLIEAIKLLEGELAQMCDQIWVTDCAATTQIERLMVCRGLDQEAAILRVQAQNPQVEKVAQADVVIDTDGPMAETVKQVEAAWTALFAHPLPEKPAGESVPAGNGAESESREVFVRRARPADIPAILLLMQRATPDALRLRRADLLHALSERSYLIGQVGAEITMVMGWNTHSTTVACIDQIVAHPVETMAVAGPALLREIEQSAQELICEVILAFLPEDGPDGLYQVFRAAGFQRREITNLPRVWLESIDQGQPAGTLIMAKVLRDVRASVK